MSVALAPFMPVGLPILVAAFGMFFGLSPEHDAPPVPTDGAP
jgi:hypothetical protein